MDAQLVQLYQNVLGDLLRENPQVLLLNRLAERKTKAAVTLIKKNR